MLYLKNDYAEGAYPPILEALARTNLESTDGYGEDPHSKHARALIRAQCACPEAAVHFLSGGTQTNLCLIAHALLPYQAAIAADTGHICTHETGAIEATGHKAIAMPGVDGKLTASLIEEAVLAHPNHHMVEPKLVYLSHPSELGTLYKKAELKAIREVCSRYHLLLYLDGARLASALAAEENDLFLPDLAQLCDAFYIGGTKCGALFGEALVIPNRRLAEGFLYTLKQRGARLAKGRMLGIQFEVLMQGDTYQKLGEKANQMAAILREGLREAGCPFLVESPTNQLFPILPDALIGQLQQRYDFIIQQRTDESHQAVRFITSWATREEDIREFLSELPA
ncbi:MAG: threonine aldolase [Provencibacterium sp.]|jgi:threonine aldolase|nr:threonine aldolase [Provencibacterium sp.]